MTYFNDKRITLNHGSGGRASWQLVEQVFLRHFDNPILNQLNDQALFPTNTGRMVMSTDSHVVSPLFFPGGDIGSLAVNGTINDVAMSGATPLYLSASFILEEGFSIEELETIVISMATTAKAAGVVIVTGDTKVVERGKGDGVYITTTGVGSLPDNVNLSGHQAEPGDVVLISGSIGDHGVAILSHRENLTFETTICSDTAALHTLVQEMLKVTPDIKCLRDPTRGGLATTLNEFAQQSAVGIEIDEASIPVKPQVNAACELLGLDPLYVANEGKLVCICQEKDAKPLLEAMHQHPLGQEAAQIGTVTRDPRGLVQMKTHLGGFRVVDWLSGEQLPRIC